MPASDEGGKSSEEMTRILPFDPKGQYLPLLLICFHSATFSHFCFFHSVFLHPHTRPTSTLPQIVDSTFLYQDCESAALNMPANLENSAVATGLEKVSFLNPKERQCQRMLKLLHNCTHLTR